MKSASTFKKVNISAIVLLIAVGSISYTLGMSRAVSADAVRPLDAFCKEITQGNTNGVGGSGNQPEVCTQDATDSAAKDEGLLAQGGIVDRVFKLISWLVGLLAIVFILVGGFKLTTSGGNKDTVKSARNMIIYALVGLAVILLSNLVFNLIIGIAKSAS